MPSWDVSIIDALASSSILQELSSTGDFGFCFLFGDITYLGTFRSLESVAPSVELLEMSAWYSSSEIITRRRVGFEGLGSGGIVNPLKGSNMFLYSSLLFALLLSCCTSYTGMSGTGWLLII